MKWITREKVQVDRVACPWLIKRFIDAQAEFIFVSAGQVEAKARELKATPFDIPGCELGHHGEEVSFDSFPKNTASRTLRCCCSAKSSAPPIRIPRVLIPQARACGGLLTASAHST